MLNPDFSAFVRSLNANDVRYLVVGGYAVAFEGEPNRLLFESVPLTA